MYSMQRHKKLNVMLALTLLIGSLTLLNGCGGGGSGSGNGTTPAAGSGIISGTAVKGPVADATVTAYGVTNGAMGSQVATGTTDGQGNFTMTIGDYSGPLMLQMSGGSYVDEATGAIMTMSPGDVLTSVIPSVASGSTITGIQMTPLTSMAQAMANNMAGGMTGA